MPYTCPQCGAEYQTHENCQERFNLCLALEFENQAAWRVHHLTVPCYMVQHNQYSRHAWLEALKLINQSLQHPLTPASAGKTKFEQSVRNWKITSDPQIAKFNTMAWSRTIAGIRMDDPETYCADIQLWAKSILQDTAPILPQCTI